MKKNILAVLLLVVVAACGGQKETPTKQVTKQKVDVAAAMKENLKTFFSTRNMGDVTYEVEVLQSLDGVEDLKFVKLILKDADRVQEQYVFTNGKYIIPEITDIATGAGIKDQLVFTSTAPADIDLSKLTLAYGNKDSKNYIVEVSDFQCPYCRRAHDYMKEKLEGKDVAVYFMHFPLAFHPKAELYARVFEGGAAQGVNFYDELYDTTPDFDSKSDAEIIEYFAAKTPNPADFKAVALADETGARIAEQMQIAQSLGITGTPALFFNGRLVMGFKPPMFDLGVDSFK